MLHKTKVILVISASIGLSACSSVFSAYKSDFSCKNSDHGKCESTLQAYDRAIGSTVEAKPTQTVEGVEGVEGHAHVHEPADNFKGYQDAVYGEVADLVAEPNTPILIKPKTIRTLVMPYTDPAKPNRLYMPRYVYSILEESKFVLGNYLKPKSPMGGFGDLLKSLGSSSEKEEE